MSVNLTEIRPSVYDLSIGEPKTHPGFFDLERDVTNFEWKGAIDLFNRQKQERTPRRFILAETMHVLYPHKTADFLNSDDMEDLIKAHVEEGRFPVPMNLMYTMRANQMRELFPKSFWRLGINPNDWVKIKPRFERPLAPQSSTDMAILTPYVRIFHHERAMLVNLIPDYFWDALKESGMPIIYLHRIRIMSEAKFKEFFKSLPIGFLQEEQVRLEEYRNSGDWEAFMELAKRLKIITAKSVTPTENGLKIEMHAQKNADEVVPDLPEARSF